MWTTWTWFRALNPFKAVMGRNGTRPAPRKVVRGGRKCANAEMRRAVQALDCGGAILFPHTLLMRHYKNIHVAQICMLRHARLAGFRVTTSSTKKGALLVQRKG